MKKNLICAALLSVAVLSACKKDKETSLTPTQLLTAKSWKAVDYGIYSNGAYNSLFGFTEDCSKDDLLIFKADGKLLSDEGATKCDATDPQQMDKGKWALSADGKTLTLTEGSGTNTNVEKATITELNANSLKTTTEDNGIIVYQNFVTQ